MSNGLELYDLVERLSNMLRAEVRKAAKAHGLQPVHLHILSYLANCNRFSDTPAHLTEFLGATKGTVSQSLQVLDRHGLIGRTREATDRRVVHLALTDQGREVLDNAVPPAPWKVAMEEMNSGHALAGGVETLLRRLQIANRSRSFGLCHTCRHFERDGDEDYRCGLTREPLQAYEIDQICHEHEFRI